MKRNFLIMKNKAKLKIKLKLIFFSDSAYRRCSSNGSWYDETMGKAYTHYRDCPDTWAGQVNK